MPTHPSVRVSANLAVLTPSVPGRAQRVTSRDAIIFNSGEARTAVAARVSTRASVRSLHGALRPNRPLCDRGQSRPPVGP